MLKVERGEARQSSLTSCKRPGSLFLLNDEVCMSTGWLENSNNIGYVVLESPKWGRVGTVSSAHNSGTRVTRLEGTLKVAPASKPPERQCGICERWREPALVGSLVIPLVMKGRKYGRKGLAFCSDQKICEEEAGKQLAEAQALITEEG